MSDIIISNPDDVARFRDELVALAENLQERLRNVEEQIDDLHQTWIDPQFEQFCSKFDEDKEVIRPLSENLKEFADGSLARYESALKDYLDVTF
jgi:hypothetical protein